MNPEVFSGHFFGAIKCRDAAKKKGGGGQTLENEQGENRELTFLHLYFVKLCLHLSLPPQRLHQWTVTLLEKHFFLSFLWRGRPITLLFRETKKSLYFCMEPS